MAILIYKNEDADTELKDSYLPKLRAQVFYSDMSPNIVSILI